MDKINQTAGVLIKQRARKRSQETGYDIRLYHRPIKIFDAFQITRSEVQYSKLYQHMHAL